MLARWRERKKDFASLSNDPGMEAKRYQSFFEGTDTEGTWIQQPGCVEHHSTTAAEGGVVSSEVPMEVVNPSVLPNDPPTPGQKVETVMPLLRHNPNQPLSFPVFKGPLHSRKPETDSKELAKTVAESMGLYMNAAREAEFPFGQQGLPAGCQGSPGKLYPLCGRGTEDNQSGAAASPSMKPPSTFPGLSQLTNGSAAECVVGSAPAPSALATALSSPTENSNSSPIGNNMVTSTSSPTYFGTSCPSLASPVSLGPVGSGLGLGHRTNYSPLESSTVGSPPLTSPHNVMKSPMSSPQSMGSVRTPPSCSANVRSSVSSPLTAVSMATSSPRNPSRSFSVSSPPSGLGLVQNDIHSPEVHEQDFKGFEFPKVEGVDGEMFNIGLDSMGMVKYIKNEPGTNYRSMCLGSSDSNMPHSPFTSQIKTEPGRELPCMNAHHSEPQHPVGLFPATETTYLSLRDNIDEYSLSGILGPPVSSLNGDYEPGVCPNNGLPKRIKQEISDGSYYQESNNTPTSAIVGVNSGGHSFHYQIGAQGTMSFSRHDVRDQTNPLLNLISPVTALMETWKTRPGVSQGALSTRGDGFPGPGCLSDNMARPFPNTWPGIGQRVLLYPSTALPLYPSTALPIYRPDALPIYRSTHLPPYRSTHLPLYPSTALPLYPATALPSTALPIYRPTALPIYRPTHLPPYPSTALPIYRPTALPIYRSTALPIYRSTHLLPYRSTHLLPYRSTHLPLYPSTALPLYPSIALTLYPSTALPSSCPLTHFSGVSVISG
ncbi:hypothetical protein P4O66_002027 [Electrophorus voltai]|uniref:Mineralocorticoid receptor n=1 Tax=Electrophorus voltai TaxID=2609070 RepID=A0AAD8Z491_9TELE|nr:hypothetical protein P4O66_002027 [Electrophorus voltai]